MYEDNEYELSLSTNFMQLFRKFSWKGWYSMNRYQCNVNGLRNGTIKTQVKNVLNELDGVKKVNVDLRRGSIEVDYNNATNENEIRNEIEHVGCRIE